MEERTLIQVKDLKKYFKTSKGMLHAVDGVSFSIPKGRTLGVVGESGCGKSTLGKVLLHLHESTAGQIFFDGVDITRFNERQLRDYRKRMQMIFQDPQASLDPRKNVSSLIGEPLKNYKLTQGKAEYEERVDEIMRTVGLAPAYRESYSHELDGGRRQRIGIGRALAVDPEFIVCDEPVSALDVSIQAQILNLLMDLQDDRGLSYLFITHDLCVVKHISSEIMVMYMGQVVEYAPTEELFRNQLHPYTRALLAAIPTVDLSRRDRERHTLTGEVSSPINPMPGCRFAPRCPYASEKCRQEYQLREVSPGHFVACHQCG